MGDDHHEISVTAGVTEGGFKAGVKSRWAAAVDRLWGSKVDRKSIPIESENAEATAISLGRVKMIEALGDLGVEKLKADPEFAARALENFLPSLLRKQENKDAVIGVALDDLRSTSPTGADEDAEAPHLDEGFLNRFERYAEEATSEVLRAKWGKVLAAEIRKPDTFSSKALRVVDELDPSTALLFERICAHRVGKTIIKCLSGNLSFTEKTALVSANLLVDPGATGQIRRFGGATDTAGLKLWMCTMELGSIAIDKPFTIPAAGSGVPEPLIESDEEPGVPVYVLTDVGEAVSSILPDNQEQTLRAYVECLAAFIAPAVVREFHSMDDGTLQLTRVHSRRKQE